MSTTCCVSQALGPRPVPKERTPRAPECDDQVRAALRTVWAVMDAPAGKRLAPFLPEMVARLRAFGEPNINDRTEAPQVRCRSFLSQDGWRHAQEDQP